MTAEEWDACDDAEVMQEFLRAGLSERRLRFFAVASVLPFRELLLDSRSREAVEIGERFADDLETVESVLVAHKRAWDVVPELPSERMAHVSAARAAGRTVQSSAGDASWLAWNEIVGLHADLREEAGATDDEKYALHFQGRSEGERFLAVVVREIFGNPFRPVSFAPEWRTDTAMALARQMYESRDFSAAPILADALQDAGCDSDELLNHLRDATAPHVRGCWAVDLVLGKA